ncbi:thioesterase [Salmonella enterica subsp. enterica serovar Oranienburg]|nr:thioesterase [Salmonella enterica subsp. enterica serovar Oranienburg]ECA1474288.1 thioesterase [Salmonella enterica subsp. enterica serovar Oranienburg]ECA9000373.1 thioesterase [Salmonella enterica subsp. enterica serovar Oranienburg]ECA9347230.1 thioesterase [Salmonella enterica subsp. enterica serovar Oranienburg]ECD3079441.1 thioesterase [Salmonella enterica subsp. enterica serovar Oranienburg]
MNDWIQRDNPGGRFRLICLPHAGGSASIYQQWRHYLPDDVEILRIQLPGREQRLNEPPFTDMNSLQRALETVLLPELTNDAVPYVLFGHSMGGLIAYEWTRRRARRRERPPALLILAAIYPPHRARIQVPFLQSDADFIHHLRQRGATPPQVLGNQELMQLLLPMLRADFTLAAGYRLDSPVPVPCPIAALSAGDDREAGPGIMSGWQRYCVNDFSLHTFSGGHFFPRTRLIEVTQRLTELLNNQRRATLSPSPYL